MKGWACSEFTLAKRDSRGLLKVQESVLLLRKKDILMVYSKPSMRKCSFLCAFVVRMCCEVTTKFK